MGILFQHHHHRKTSELASQETTTSAFWHNPECLPPQAWRPFHCHLHLLPTYASSVPWPCTDDKQAGHSEMILSDSILSQTRHIKGKSWRRKVSTVTTVAGSKVARRCCLHAASFGNSDLNLMTRMKQHQISSLICLAVQRWARGVRQHMTVNQTHWQNCMKFCPFAAITSIWRMCLGINFLKPNLARGRTSTEQRATERLWVEESMLATWNPLSKHEKQWKDTHIDMIVL